jgi:hypothetical protein
MSKTTQHGAHHEVPGKKPLDPHLLSGSKGIVDDVHD